MLHTDDDVEDDESDEELDLHRPPPRWLQQSVSSQPPPLMQPSLAATRMRWASYRSPTVRLPWSIPCC